MTEHHREVMQKALEAWQTSSYGQPSHQKAMVLAMTALRSALAEPVAWKHDCAALLTNDVELWIDFCPHCGKPRTAPPASVSEASQRKPLTDEEILNIFADVLQTGTFFDVARAIERAHGIGK